MGLNVSEPTIMCETPIDLKNDTSVLSWNQKCLHGLYFQLAPKAEQYQL